MKDSRFRRPAARVVQTFRPDVTSNGFDLRERVCRGVPAAPPDGEDVRQCACRPPLGVNQETASGLAPRASQSEVLLSRGLTSAATAADRKEIGVSSLAVHDPQSQRLADAIAERVGPQRFNVWFNNSTRLDLKQDRLEIAVPNEFICEWIQSHFFDSIEDATTEIVGCALPVRFSVLPQLFEAEAPGHNGIPLDDAERRGSRAGASRRVESDMAGPGDRLGQRSRLNGGHAPEARREPAVDRPPVAEPPRNRLRHDLSEFVVGSGNEVAHRSICCVAQYPGSQCNPLFIYGGCGLGKSHLLQGVCRRFSELHPTRRWAYMTGEEFVNDFVSSLRGKRADAFKRRLRELDLLVVDDVHYLHGRSASQLEFLHTFNAIEAMGKQVVLAAAVHPRDFGRDFGESLVNRFVSGLVVRLDPPNFETRCRMLEGIARRLEIEAGPDVLQWIARRVTQNTRELEGALTRVRAHAQLSGGTVDLPLAQEVLGELDRVMLQPARPDAILHAVCAYFGLAPRDLMSGRRQRTISLARSLAMYLIRHSARLSFPEIGLRMGRRNHSTVISACRRIERAVAKNDRLQWLSAVGNRSEEATELVQRLEEQARACPLAPGEGPN